MIKRLQCLRIKPVELVSPYLRGVLGAFALLWLYVHIAASAYFSTALWNVRSIITKFYNEVYADSIDSLHLRQSDCVHLITVITGGYK